MASRPGAGRGFEHEIGGRDRRGRAAAKPSAIGVENCWSAWLSSERRVCDGSSAASLASMASSAAGEPARARMARPNLRRNRTAPPRRRRRRSSSPGALGVGAAEGRLHGGAERLRVDGAAAFEIGEQHLRGRDQRSGGIGGAAARDGGASRVAAAESGQSSS